MHMAERMTKAIQLEALEAQREAAAKTAAEKEGSAANASGSKSEPEPPRPFEAPSSKAPS